MKKKILLGFLITIIVAQFFRPDTTNPESDPELDFVTIVQPSEEIASVLKTSCYDCHSNQTEYPWYMQISPVSWWIKDHIDEGREELNFSDWGAYSAKRQKHKLDECIELIEEGEMPLDSYTWTHGDASLDENTKQLLNEWFLVKMNSIKIDK